MATKFSPRLSTKADILDTLLYRFMNLADDERSPSRTAAEVERRAHEAECIASQLRAQYRGR